jgi:hypothetical protein
MRGLVVLKTCSACLVPKSLDEFNNVKRGKYGKDQLCRRCRNICKAKERLLLGKEPKLSFLENILSKIETCGHGDICLYCCWPWIGSRHPNGYGRIGLRHTVSILATHIVYEIYNACPIPPDKLVLHYCDNPPCVNFTHLWIGTYKDNNDDRDKKGRSNRPYGERHLGAKLVKTDIIRIRSLYEQGMSAYAIGPLYPYISIRNIRSIIDRNTWKYI